MRSLVLVALLLGQARAEGLRVEFFDVGQGDAALITSPSGKLVLIDGGPPEGAAGLVERLRGRGPIDLVILSHRHLDHLGGLERVVNEVGARVYLDAEVVHASPQYERLMRALAVARVEVKSAVEGRAIDLGGGARITLLGPPAPLLAGTRSDVNANSVIARVDFGAVAVLFTGDAEAETERWLVANRPAQLKARVIKMAHHGSRHSSTGRFVAAVGAELAVASAGAGNEYGHPSGEAMARWEAAGARVVRTDRDGEIVVESDGKEIVVRTARARVVGWPGWPVGRVRGRAGRCVFRERVMPLARARAGAGQWGP